MDGFYSIWTGPFKLKHEDTPFFMEDYDLLTLILSAAAYKKNNGRVRMYADKAGAMYIDSIGLKDLFDDGIKIMEPDEDINPKVFWAAGKLKSLSLLDKPSVMIDLDLIIWKNLDDFFTGADIYGIHREQIRNEIYPDTDFFKVKRGYRYPDGLDKAELPLNTAMLYIESLDFTHKYANESLRFMKSCTEQNENLRHMVFAEQRLLPMMVSAEGLKIRTMFPLGEDIGIQDFFTHIWGHKNILKYNRDERMKYCMRVINRLKKDFPDHMVFVSSNDIFREYIKD